MTALPNGAGIGLRSVHHRELLATLPRIDWLEVHSENFFGTGGEPLRVLEQARRNYPVSLHGVGLSLGSSDPLSLQHLQQLKTLIDRIEPAAVSEHLCWSSIDGQFFNDLLPLPYTLEALHLVCSHIEAAQEFLGHRLLIENLSSYLQFRNADMAEWEFIATVARRTGCAILLDVNNIYVSACNHGFDPGQYLAAMPIEAVHEIHLAGFEENAGLLVDTHSRPVSPAVWQLYQQTLECMGPIPTLIEWDNDIPSLDTLLAEAAKAQALLSATKKLSDACIV